MLENLRLMRLEAKMSQQELADRIGMGIDQSQVCRYESGKYQPEQGVLIKMANILNTNVDFLLGNTVHKHRYPPIDEDTLSAAEQGLIAKYRTLEENLQQNVIAIVNTLSSDDADTVKSQTQNPSKKYL